MSYEKEVFMIHKREDANDPLTAIKVPELTRHDVREYSHVWRARSAHSRDIFEDQKKYKVNKYRVTYTLIEEDSKDDSFKG